ncbi:NusG domain II-containing protein [Kineothrix sp. MB12-C1]|uniref:NusG domain II-containing protein n=1 Tax=Kineothrix sp. MB12-C1 TaxID=3070215 RepID=UPI0027D1F3B6|nr:NusG domain II-containing protein [Kineothrix sp. MB12-C1]WMC92068.1 NusG domain II-containing protein [Kineothrix sp. MB12-C1]
MLKKNDVILVGGLLIIALAAMLFVFLTKEEGGKVVVTVDGEIYETLSLNEDITLSIGEEDERYNVLEIKDGKVSMAEANCPDKLCVRHAPIHYNHESIICLPHKVTIAIQNGEEQDIDIIAQ